MSCSHIPIEGRSYPLQQPKKWQVKFPRYMLELPEHVNDITVTYLGIQPRHQSPSSKGVYTNLHPHVTSAAQRQVADKIEYWIGNSSSMSSPGLWEKMYVETGYDIPDTEIYITYWIGKNVANEAIRDLDLQRLYQNLESDEQQHVGLWHETFTVPKSRFETIYSGNDYQPGIASLPGAEQVGHTFTGYWGAARDRLPSSASDRLEPEHISPLPNFNKDIYGRIIGGYNDVSMIHIRSGQYWERCKEDERQAYEENLEPVLRKGMAFLEEHAADTGDFGLRFLRNITTNRRLQLDENRERENSEVNAQISITEVLANGIANIGSVVAGSITSWVGGVMCDSASILSYGARDREAKSKQHDQSGLAIASQRPRRETCSSGFFRSLMDLEKWAATHPTHQKIFHGAHEHSTKFGKAVFKMRTWHEVAALKPGEVAYEYINCEPRTGLIPFLNV